jgi:hypothetical protein
MNREMGVWVIDVDPHAGHHRSYGESEWRHPIIPTVGLRCRDGAGKPPKRKDTFAGSRCSTLRGEAPGAHKRLLCRWGCGSPELNSSALPCEHVDSRDD